MLLSRLNNIFRVTKLSNSKFIISKRCLTSQTSSGEQANTNSDDLIRNRILESSLKFVPQYGFTIDAIEQGFI